MPDSLDRPIVVANFAITWDGKISTVSHTPSTFSSPLDKRRLSEIRAQGDAVLVGAGTLRADNMKMVLNRTELRQARLARGQSGVPMRVIVSNRGSVDPSLKVFQHPVAPVHLFTTEAMPLDARAALNGHAKIHVDSTPEVDLPAMLKCLHSELGVRRLICEGGATLFASMLSLNFIDELYLTWCPILFGSAQAPTITGLPGAAPLFPASRSMQLKSWETNSHGEAFLHYIFDR